LQKLKREAAAGVAHKKVAQNTNGGIKQQTVAQNTNGGTENTRTCVDRYLAVFFVLFSC
jgi:hypothetical protein